MAWFDRRSFGDGHPLPGKMDSAITAHTYPPPVWSRSEVLVVIILVSTANLATASNQYRRLCSLRSPS